MFSDYFVHDEVSSKNIFLYTHAKVFIRQRSKCLKSENYNCMVSSRSSCARRVMQLVTSLELKKHSLYACKSFFGQRSKGLESENYNCMVSIGLSREYLFCFLYLPPFYAYGARLAQSVEHETLNLRVVGSSPTLGADSFCWNFC